MQVPVIKDGVAAVAHRANIMQAAKSVQGVIDKDEITARWIGAAQPPDNLPRIPVDFGHFADMAAGKQDMAIFININGIHMGEVKTAPQRVRQVGFTIERIEIVPRPPLKDQLIVRRKFLNDRLIHIRIGIGARVVQCHIDGSAPNPKEQIPPIFLDLQLMAIGVIAVHGPVGTRVIEVLVNAAELGPGDHPVLLDLEIPPAPAPVPDGIAVVVQHHGEARMFEEEVSWGWIVIDGDHDLRKVAGHGYPV
ncbi:hypothetical protein ES703_07477 [subsurface metagenome]